jgi:hypothetical protein
MDEWGKSPMAVPAKIKLDYFIFFLALSLFDNILAAAKGAASHGLGLG